MGWDGELNNEKFWFKCKNLIRIEGQGKGEGKGQGKGQGKVWDGELDNKTFGLNVCI